MAVESETGEVVFCHTLRKLPPVAVGDRVVWQRNSTESGCVLEIKARRSVLTRPARETSTRLVAANLDQVLIVFASQPRCDFLLLDQYLVICENTGLRPLLICNKTDLNARSEPFDSALELYRSIGYTTLRVSAKSGFGLSELKQELIGRTSLLAGQSGVGKSSLTNALIPNRNIRTAQLSASALHGKHTTTASTLFHVPTGGDLIDSPGVAIFGLAETDERDLAFGYREFQPHLDHCRFKDCRHIKEPGCAISSAVDHAIISRERFDRFNKLREKLPRATKFA